MIYESTSARVIFLALALFLSNQLVTQDAPPRSREEYPRKIEKSLPKLARQLARQCWLAEEECRCAKECARQKAKAR